MRWLQRRSLVLVVLWLTCGAAAHADTGSALGDRAGEGSTAFTGLAQAPEANLFTGALTSAVPLDVPPGRRNMTPQLALQYSSAGGPTPFGVGWDLPLGRLERSTRWGVPRCTGPHTDEFTLTLPSGAAELVRESPGSNFYRPAVEQAYVRAEKFETQNYWIVRDRSGVTYTFGAADAARVGSSTPLTFMAQAADGTCQLTTTWALTRIEDPNGNIIDLTWGKVLNVLYPVTIRYGGSSRAGGPVHVYTVRFLPEWRPVQDRIVSYRSGVAARLILRIYAIEITTDLPAPDTLVRRYTLQYRDAGDGYQSLLSAVGVTGRPTQHLVYTPSVTAHRSTLVTFAKPPGAWGELRIVNDSQEVSQSVLDMNGDGVLDLVRSDDAPASAWSVYWGYVGPDGAFGLQSTATAWQAPGNWSTLRNVVVSSGACNGNGWSCTRTDTFDITGDGIPDHIDASNGSNWLVYRGRGVPQWGFAPAISWPAPNRPFIRRSYTFETYQDVLDINGDGLPDLIVSSPNQAAPYQWDVYLNTGAGFEPTPQPSFTVPVKSLVVQVHGEVSQLLTDFNGDGLPDLIRAGEPWDARCQASGFDQGSCLEVYFNTGRGFAATATLIPVPLSATVQHADSPTGEEDDRVVSQDLFDINGDGLPDWVARDFDDGEWHVLLNLGGTLEPVAYVLGGFWPAPYRAAVAPRVWQGGHEYFRSTVNGNSRSDMLDVDGDGFLDLVTAGASTWTVRLHGAGERPNLLGLMENGLGGTNTIVYRPSTAYDNSGGDAQPDLPFVTWVVDKTRQNDGLCTPPPGADVFVPGPAPSFNPCIDSGSELVATYQYQDGRFDAQTREFRGFRRVVRTSVEGSADPGTQTVTYFGQDAATDGRVLQVDAYAGSGALVRSEVNQWRTRSPGTGRTQIWLYANHRLRWDLIGSGAPDLVSTIADDPDPYGNTLHHYSFSLLGGPRVDTYTTYATPRSGSYVYDRPAGMQVTQPSGVLEEKWFYYDGGTADGLANGIVAAGNLKRVRARLTPTNPNGPETRMTYDAYGNLTAVTDANGRSTATVFDSRALYPLGVINPFWHVTTTDVDYRWGLPTRVSDPNNAVTSFAYDDAGRRTCVARPGDSLANCSIAYAYHFASQPGELSWVEETERQDSPHPPLTTRHYVDALGRPRYTETLRVVDGTPTTVRSNQIVYDPAGRVRTVYHPYLAGAGTPNNGATTYDYHLNGSAYIDPLGRVYRTINADQTARRTIYAAALTTVYDEEGQRTDTLTDAFGRAVSQTAYSGAAPYVTTERSYDALGRLLTLRQGGTLLRTISYDSLGRKTQMVDQDSGTWRYAYDGVGNLRWQDDPRPAHHVEFCYDAINRPTRRCSYANDSASLASCSDPNACSDPAAVTNRYDEGAVPNARGRVTTVRDASGSTHIDEYDARGRRRRVTTDIDLAGANGHAHFAFAYDANDRIAATTYPDGEVVFTEYDDAGQPIALRNLSNAFYVTDARYDLFGRPTRVDHANGVSDTRSYGGPQQQHRLLALASAKGAARHLDLPYFLYTPRGLLSLVIDGRNLNGELSNSAAYTYDALGRLTSFNSSYNPIDAAFSHDAMGNLTRCGDRYLRYDNAARPHQATALRVGSPSAPAQPVLYDANGNRTAKGAQTYSYDSTDRVARIATAGGEVEFVYDYRGEQVGKIVTAGATVRTSRFYGALAETSAGRSTKWYFLGPLRVASQSTDSVAWETAAGASSGLQTAEVTHGRALLALAASHGADLAGPAVLCVTIGLLAAPWRRKRVVGIAVRPGHALGVAVAFLVGTLPAPGALAPQAAQAASPPSVRHYHLDHLGSTQVVTDSAGEIVEQVRYLPYGTVRGRWNRDDVLIADGSDANRREFTGFLSEPLSGLQYAGARFYDPEIGSFLTQDPATQFSSPYSYGGGDPVNWRDPNGEEFVIAFLAALILSAVASAAVNAIIAAAQGAPAIAIGRAAVGGAIAGAVGVGLGVVASVATLGAGALAGTLAPGVSIAAGAQQLGEVAWRSAFSSIVANAAGQSAAAVGAPDAAVTGIGIAAGLLSSVAYDHVVTSESAVPAVETPAEAQTVSTTMTHTRVTLGAATRSSLRSGAAEILDANLARDRGFWNLLNNEDHFDFGAEKAFERFRGEAFKAAREGDGARFLSKTGAALHHLQDQYALGHMFPGTSYLKGPVGATFRFVIHNVVGGEVTFTQASQNASMRFLESLPRPPI